VPPFRAAQIAGARFAFFVSLAHVKDRLKQGYGVFESRDANLFNLFPKKPGAVIAGPERTPVVALDSDCLERMMPLHISEESQRLPLKARIRRCPL